MGFIGTQAVGGSSPLIALIETEIPHRLSIRRHRLSACLHSDRRTKAGLVRAHNTAETVINHLKNYLIIAVFSLNEPDINNISPSQAAAVRDA